MSAFSAPRPSLRLTMPSPETAVAAALVAALLLAGVLAVVFPVGAVALVALAWVAWLGTRAAALPRVFMAALGGILAAYMFLGKGAAYAGVPPLFIGEACLSLGLLTIITALPRIHLTSVHLLLLAFMAFGLARTVPFIAAYKMDALRDAALWYYGLFAIAVSVAVTPVILLRLFHWYARILPFLLLWIPISGVLFLASGRGLPTWPGTEVPLIVYKAGDMAVHLAGAIAFLLFGLYARTRRPGRLTDAMVWVLVILAGGVIALSRGATASVVAGLAVAFLLRPSRRWMPMVTAAAIIGILFVTINPTFNIGVERKISASQFENNLLSVFSKTNDRGVNAQLEDTKSWRQRWWDKIWADTVHGPHFLAGRGFGLNLAVADGFPTGDDNAPLRSPHNGHMTILARMGVPGLLLWIALQATFGASLFAAFRRATARGLEVWAAVDAWILVYWVAALVDMSFDVYLEGPQGGIWFWSLMGLGLGVLEAQRKILGEHDGEAALPVAGVAS